MTLTQLEYAVAVAKYRHFGKAAKASFVTQPTLSMQIQKLEDQLGVTLFDRSRSPILVTSEGERVIEQARVVLHEARRLVDIVGQAKGELSGPFRLGVIPTLSTYILPLFVRKFVDRHPKLELVIEESKTEEIIRQLRDDEIDAGLLVTPLREAGVVERILFYEPFHLFVAPEHPLSKQQSIREEDLDINEIWLLDKGNCFRDQALRICSESPGVLEEGRGGIRFESGSLETLKSMVLTGAGYTLLPDLAVRMLPSSQQRYVRHFFEPVPTREVSLVHARTSFRGRIIAALEQQILRSIPKQLRDLTRRQVGVVEVA